MSDAEQKYIPVPVEAAHMVAGTCQKDVVVIVSYDHASGLVHTTTYGRSAADKVTAAQLGEMLARATGADLSRAKTFEDFRSIAAGQNAADAEALRRLMTPAPLYAWHEDFGPALWWKFPVTEPPYVGTPYDDAWPRYHTHWTPLFNNKEVAEIERSATTQATTAGTSGAAGASPTAGAGGTSA